MPRKLEYHNEIAAQTIGKPLQDTDKEPGRLHDTDQEPGMANIVSNYSISLAI